jgi:hypothetical protein
VWYSSLLLIPIIRVFFYYEYYKVYREVLSKNASICFELFYFERKKHSEPNDKCHFLPSTSKTTELDICYCCLDNCMILHYCAIDINEKLCRTYCESRILDGPKFVIITEH